MKQSFFRKFRILIPLLFERNIFSVVIFRSYPKEGDSITVGDMKAVFNQIKKRPKYESKVQAYSSNTPLEI